MHGVAHHSAIQHSAVHNSAGRIMWHTTVPYGMAQHVWLMRVQYVRHGTPQCHMAWCSMSGTAQCGTYGTQRCRTYGVAQHGAIQHGTACMAQKGAVCTTRSCTACPGAAPGALTTRPLLSKSFIAAARPPRPPWKHSPATVRPQWPHPAPHRGQFLRQDQPKPPPKHRWGGGAALKPRQMRTVLMRSGCTFLPLAWLCPGLK